MDVSLVIPAYNESKIVLDTIRTVSARLAELKVDEQTRRQIQDEISQFYSSTDICVQEHSMEELLERMTKEYHRNTGS